MRSPSRKGGTARALSRRPKSPHTAAADYKLAPRENQILKLLARGLLYKEIAEQLGLSITTVNSYVRSTYGKLRVHSRSQAVAKFLQI
jgi:DNA-binding NarL/FixJ family response regulator